MSQMPRDNFKSSIPAITSGVKREETLNLFYLHLNYFIKVYTELSAQY